VDKRKSQRAFVGITLTTVLSIAFVLIVYAAIIGTRYGGEVTVTPSGGLGGTIYYSTSQSGPWTQTTLPVSPEGTAWYCVLITPGNQYTGPVSIAWMLQKKGGLSDWSDATQRGTNQTTSIVLTTASQTIYVEPAGTNSALNFNWGGAGYGNITGSYRVVAEISSTG